jgi:small subunit ribosomal protein S2
MIDFASFPDVAPEYDLRDLLEAGCHFGHDASKWHPHMSEWIYMKKDGIHVFDLEKTARQLQLAYNYLYHLGKENKEIIFVGTKRQSRELINQLAKEAGLNWISSRWLGGLLTNWQQVYKSLKKMLEIEEGLKQDKYQMYTKYEQTQLEKEAGRLARFFDGLRGLKAIPDALFVIDPKKEQIAIKEAKIIGVSVIALVDSNTNPQDVDLIIPANDDGRGSIEFVVSQLATAYKKGSQSASKTLPGKTLSKTPGKTSSKTLPLKTGSAMPAKK